MKLLSIINVAFFGTDGHDIDHLQPQPVSTKHQQPTVNSVLCRDGKIVEINTSDRIRALAAKLEKEHGSAVETHVIDGNDFAIDEQLPLLSPAFIDAHCHVLNGGGRMTYIIDLSRARNKAEFLAAIRDHLKQEQGDSEEQQPQQRHEWILASGWDEERIGEMPTLSWLDEISATRPMFFYRCDFHSALCNSAALAAGGVTKATESPPGGFIVRDAETGELTGLLREMACDLVSVRMPVTSEKRLRAALAAATANYHRFGVTCCHDMTTMDRHTNPAEFAFYRKMLREGDLRLRMRTAIRVKEFEEAAAAGLITMPKQNTNEAEAAATTTTKTGENIAKRDVQQQHRRSTGEARDDGEKEEEMLRLTFVKMFTDGSLGSRTARMMQPYAPRVSECASVTGRRHADSGADSRCECGLFITHFDDLKRGVSRARQVGLIPAAHAIGDAAVSAVVDAMLSTTDDDVGDATPSMPVPLSRRIPRGRIEHCQHILLRDLERLRGSSIVASMQPLHMASDAIVAERVLGQWRRHGAFPLASMLRHTRIPMAFGSDWPVVAPNPLLAVHAACTRRGHWAAADTMAGVDSANVPSGNTAWEPRQCLTLREALEAHTSGAADSAGDGNLLGRIRPGLAADFVLLSPAVTSLLVANGANQHLLRDDPAAGKPLIDEKVFFITLLGGECVYMGGQSW